MNVDGLQAIRQGDLSQIGASVKSTAGDEKCTQSTLNSNEKSPETRMITGFPGMCCLFKLNNGIVFSTIYGGNIYFEGTISIRIIHILPPF